MTAQNSIGSMRQGQTLPWTVFFFRDTLNRTVNMVAGSTYTLYIYTPSTMTTIAGAGSFDTSNETSGSVTYRWSATDSSVTGQHEVFIGYVPPSSTDQGYTLPMQWEVLPLFGQQ